MNADEFRAILDRFHAELATAGQWAIDTNYRGAPEPEWVGKLDGIWRDLDRDCALMLAEEQHIQRMRENWMAII